MKELEMSRQSGRGDGEAAKALAIAIAGRECEEGLQLKFVWDFS